MGDFIVRIPESYVPERQYVIDTLLREHFGLEISVEVGGAHGIQIRQRGSQTSLTVRDDLFSREAVDWLRPPSLPVLPLRTWRPADDGLDCERDVGRLPVLYGTPVFDQSYAPLSNRGVLSLDVFGSAFFLLSRYEEIARPVVDEHGRFTAHADVMARAGVLRRPLVDEYAEVLWSCMQRLWPGLRRRVQHFRQVLTHDVDIPFQHAFQGPLRLVRSCLADLLLRRQPLGPFHRVKQWARVRFGGDSAADPANTFEKIMTLSEGLGTRSAFYFIVSHTDTRFDSLYDHRHPWIAELLKQVHARGHEIGLHASYGSWRDAEQVVREVGELRRFCEEIGVRNEVQGVRQHWLRVKMPETLRNFASAGFTYDCSFAYPEDIGFRGGTCRPFRVFDAVARTPLRILERPTAVMDVTVLEPALLGLGTGERALEAILSLKNACRKYRGEFVVLWHNNRMYRPGEWELYEAVVRG